MIKLMLESRLPSSPFLSMPDTTDLYSRKVCLHRSTTVHLADRLSVSFCLKKSVSRVEVSRHLALVATRSKLHGY